MKTRPFAAYLILLFATLLLAACGAGPNKSEEQPAQNTKVVYIGPELADCSGTGPQKCMSVKEDPNADYQLFYSQIEGFTYEEGYDYVLLIQEEDIPNPPADAPRKKWTQVGVISKTPAQPASIAQLSIEGSLWRLLSFANTKGSLSDVLPGSEITVEFIDGKVGGSAGCNSYFASYQVGTEQLTINGAGSTMMFCTNPEGVMDQETAYLAALEQAASYNLADERLQITDAQGQTILIYTRVEALSLSGVDWRLVSYNNGKGSIVSLLAGSQITALFDINGALGGSSGCNKYNTSYETDGKSLQIGTPASTRMACNEPQNIMEQENEYLAALEQTAYYEIKNKELQIFDAQGAYLLIFKAP